MKINDFEVQIAKKDIKNIHLGVYPPEGRIRVAAPLNINDETIRLFIISKIHWINKQCTKFIEQQRQTKREYVSGETHYFLGRKYRLNVIYTNSHQKVEITKKTHIDLHIKPNTSIEKREALLNRFYRMELKKQSPSLINKWSKIIGVKVNQINIKKMKTKWGTSNPNYNRIWLNLELAKYSIHCIEYVIVHEMTHFLEKNHTEKFYRLMDSFLPNWQQYKNELNNSVLGYFEWNNS